MESGWSCNASALGTTAGVSTASRKPCTPPALVGFLQSWQLPPLYLHATAEWFAKPFRHLDVPPRRARKCWSRQRWRGFAAPVCLHAAALNQAAGCPVLQIDQLSSLRSLFGPRVSGLRAESLPLPGSAPVVGRRLSGPAGRVDIHRVVDTFTRIRSTSRALRSDLWRGLVLPRQTSIAPRHGMFLRIGFRVRWTGANRRYR